MSEMGTYIETRRGDRAVTIGRTAMVGAVVGMIAGMAMAMIEMLAGWLSAGHSAWDAPMAITSWVFGTQYFGQPSDHVGAIIVGLTLHMMNSAILGIAFLTIATRYLRRPTLLQAILAGLAFGAVAYIIVLQGLTQVRGGGEQLLLTGHRSLLAASMDHRSPRVRDGARPRIHRHARSRRAGQWHRPQTRAAGAGNRLGDFCETPASSS
jgi:hypothetical protein